MSTINGGTKRYLEKWALLSEARPGKVAKLADSLATWTGDTGTTISGFDHLAGESVVVWGDSGPVMDTGDPTEPRLHPITGGGVLTLSSVLADGMAGLPYTADWASTKLGWVPASMGTAQGGRKRISEYSLSLLATHSAALEIGGDTGSLRPIPRVVKGKAVPSIFEEIELDMTPAGGDWATDPRLHLRAKAPLPATVRSIVFEVDAK